MHASSVNKTLVKLKALNLYCFDTEQFFPQEEWRVRDSTAIEIASSICIDDRRMKYGVCFFIFYGSNLNYS